MPRLDSRRSRPGGRARNQIGIFVACAAIASMVAIASRTSLAQEEAPFRLAMFRAEVTPRLGHPLLGGQLAGAKSVDDPLWAHGVVLLGPGKPIVLVAVDWCEIRNDAYTRWQDALAEAAGTSRQRVLVTSVHQHDAPIADLTAERLLREAGVDGQIIDPDYHERTVRRVATALANSLAFAQPVTHLGTGQAKVERVASNRRVQGLDGKVSFDRYSATRDAAMRDQPEGLVDPNLKTISFWNGPQPLAFINAYATHPMSHYGAGAISSDFVGLARERRRLDQPAIHQMYLSGCSGDVTAGKYNDGSPENRALLADRMYNAMVEAMAATVRHPLTKLDFRSEPLVLPHREGNQSVEALRARLADAKQPTFQRALAAMGLSSRTLHPGGHEILVTAIDLGPAQIVLLPGESLVGYQLLAQQLRPDVFVMAVGYGECAPGYIPTDSASREGYADSQGWCWVAPEVESRVTDALRRALQAPPVPSR
jgi:hypothetical protein